MDDPFAPYEQADQEHRAAQRRARFAQAALNAALTDLMARPQGRLLLRWLLEECRCFSALNLEDAPPGADALRLGFTEGRRYVGARLLRLLRQTGPEHLPRLLNPQEDETYEPDPHEPDRS
ncbi:Bbp19 family protein [Desulfovibrio legallii]|jgi:hypothetical protein|uniref:Bbp19-like phage domain-containing protein n=1 Tax=Desulfovibrio legallii TaxID=571438 RepID=A0A1G7KUL8_9BACT|nr:hypothetical protein [Desulfovibrio legallii]SDF40913.1 hypothetical protein SAMN05192586_1056 [Desulfovibrio legallii]